MLNLQLCPPCPSFNCIDCRFVSSCVSYPIDRRTYPQTCLGKLWAPYSCAGRGKVHWEDSSSPVRNTVREHRGRFPQLWQCSGWWRDWTDAPPEEVSSCKEGLELGLGLTPLWKLGSIATKIPDYMRLKQVKKCLQFFEFPYCLLIILSFTYLCLCFLCWLGS